MEMALKEYLSGKLVSGGAICERCGKRLYEGERVFALAVEVEDMKEYLYCQGCRPDDAGLPKGVLSLEPAQVVEETGADERTMGFEVQVGSLCTQCGHYFEIGEWLYVGVVEGLHHGFVYCGECRESEMEEEA
jgi:hypothetical protein